ncbi:Hsp20/alpha crystallin family protein [Halosimplex halophilum]|uniref:Hsp20/alpha crystallin family protein n=1 Tax=Halosimplex halophilum TaxID=2559572 RepID=UPI00107F8AC1|nr:Hsp20/alpha crystallin family protein [Halosimplex halophilum]
MTHHPDHEIELYRDDGIYRVFVDLQGFDPADIDVTWVNNRLTVSARRTGGPGSSRVFDHQVNVPRAVDADGITATYRDGVLDVELPVAPEDDPPGRAIEIEE